MNEIIKELANQCGFRSNPDVYDRNQSFDIPKFAELIIKKTMQVVANQLPSNQYLDVAHAVIKHFEVEE